MAVLKLLTKSYATDTALRNVINYIGKYGLEYCGGFGVNPEYAYEEMLLVKKIWHKEDGQQVRHFVLSFAKEEKLNTQQKLKLAYDICRYYPEFQCFFGCHYDTDNPHIHFVMNTVSAIDGHRYSGGPPDWYGLREYIESLLPGWPVRLEYGKE